MYLEIYNIQFKNRQSQVHGWDHHCRTAVYAMGIGSIVKQYLIGEDLIEKSKHISNNKSNHEFDNYISRVFDYIMNHFLELVMIAAMMHDTGRLNYEDGVDKWEKESADNAYDFLLSSIQDDEIKESVAYIVASIILNKDHYFFNPLYKHSHNYIVYTEKQNKQSEYNQQQSIINTQIQTDQIDSLYFNQDTFNSDQDNGIYEKDKKQFNLQSESQHKILIELFKSYKNNIDKLRTEDLTGIFYTNQKPLSSFFVQYAFLHALLMNLQYIDTVLNSQDDVLKNKAFKETSKHLGYLLEIYKCNYLLHTVTSVNIERKITSTIRKIIFENNFASILFIMEIIKLQSLCNSKKKIKNTIKIRQIIKQNI